MSGFAPLELSCGTGRDQKALCLLGVMELAKGFEPPTG
jgi:hypothetical protein